MNSSYQKCPRCGDTYYEQLAGHGYCIGCNYSSDIDKAPQYAFPADFIQYVKLMQQGAEEELQLALSLGQVH